MRKRTASIRARAARFCGHRWGWTAFAVVCISAAALKTWQNHEYDRRQAAYAKQLREFHAALQERVRTGLYDVLKAVVTGERRLPPTPPVAPAPPWGWGLIERCREHLARFGLVVWLALIPMSLLVRPFRRQLACVQLATAIVWAEACLLDPKPPRSGGMAVAVLLFGPAVFGASLVILAWVFTRRSKVGPPRCENCEYNSTGNWSGVCPECGRPVSAQNRRKLMRLRGPQDELQQRRQETAGAAGSEGNMK